MNFTMRSNSMPMRRTPKQRYNAPPGWLMAVTVLLIQTTTALSLKHHVVGSGLRNLGNTCYMNAQLQCAFHIPKVREIVLRKEEQEDDDATVATVDTEDDDSIVSANSSSVESETPRPVMATPKSKPPSEALQATRELFQNMLSSSQAHTPRSFCMRLGIPPMVQQDSQEFWKLLLPAIKEEELCDLYRGTYIDYIQALDGSGQEKRREEVFTDLSLDVILPSDKKKEDDPEYDLLRSLQQQFGEPELLSVAEGNGWRPAKGKDKVDAHKGNSLMAKGLPPILQFHLKRFQYDWQTDVTKKLNDRCTFPQCLDLSQICSDTKEEESPLALYELQSVVVHVGEYGAGHYYAYVRPDISQDEWYRFNDDVVEAVSFEEVTDDVFGGRQVRRTKKWQSNNNKSDGNVLQRVGRMLRGNGSRKAPFGWGGQTSNAYVVQYIRKQDIPFLYKDDFRE